MYNFPTIVIFCEGLGIAAAKALIEATAGVGGLSFPLRRDVRMYYRVRVAGSCCASDNKALWRTVAVPVCKLYVLTMGAYCSERIVLTPAAIAGVPTWWKG